MKLLPLYPGDNRLPIEKSEPLDLDPKCERCSLSKDARSVCMGGDGDNWEKGGILFVAEAPDRDDDRQSRPFVGRTSGGLLRQLVKKIYTGPAAYDYVVRCHPKSWEGATLEQVEACQGYLNSTIKSEQPNRIITFGAKAAAGILGANVQINSARRGYTYLYNQGKEPIPVIFLGHPAVAYHNKFKKRELIEDLAWATTVEPPPPPPWDACTRIVETVEDALDAEEEFAFADWVTYDTETAGKLFNKDFKIIAMAATAARNDSPWTWTREALTDPEIRAPLERTLANEEIRLGGQSIKYDMLCARSAWGIEVRNPWHDTRLSRKTVNCEADANLAVMGHLVGMGGHKMEAKNAIASGLRKVQGSMRKLLKGTLDEGEPLLKGLDPDIDASIRAGGNPKDYKYAFTTLEILQRYCALDVVTTDRLVAKLEDDIIADTPEVAYAWNTVVRPVNQALEQVEAWGMAVSIDTIQNVSAFCKEKLSAIEQRIAPYDFEPSSPAQVAKVLFGKLGLPVVQKTGSGAPSTNAASLKALRGRHPLVQDILDWRKYDKLDGTYATGLQQHIRSDGRIHPNLKPDGTRSGRWSCVVGETPILTERGPVPLNELRVGDKAWTHKERWREVLHVLDQGLEDTYEVVLSNRKVLTCTISHKLLTEAGTWLALGELLERFEEVGSGCWEPASSDCTLPRHPTDAHGGAGSTGTRDDVPQRGARSEDSLTASGVAGAEEDTLLDVQDGKQKSNARKDRESASQLEGDLRREGRVHDLPPQRKEATCTSSSDGKCSGARGTTSTPGHSPYRREQDEQRLEQSRSSDEARPRYNSFFAGEGNEFVSVEAVYARGTRPVFDLTIAEDHSYSNCGVFSKNCTDPNLQNLPSEKEMEGKLLRGCFVAEPGKFLVAMDYSQVELRVACMLSGDEEMLRVFKSGEDFHTTTAKLISQMAFGIPPEQVEKKHRRIAKTFNFGLLYGMGDATLAAALGITENEATLVRRAILGNFRQLDAYTKECLRDLDRTGYTHTWWQGKKCRRRPLFDAAGRDSKKKNTAENGAFNCLDEETEALTQRGWVKGFDLTPEDILMTKNAESGGLEWQGMTDLKLWPEYEGELVEFKSRSFSAVSTPDHRWLVYNKGTGKNECRLTDQLSDWGDHRIHRTGDFKGTQKAIHDHDFVELVGWFLTDGGFYGGNEEPKYNVEHWRGVQICQSQRANPGKVVMIDNLLKRYGFKGNRALNKSNECIYWRMTKAESIPFYEMFPDKTLTVSFLNELTRPQLELLRDTMLLGDGCSPTEDRDDWQFCCSDKERAGMFQLLLTMCGQASTLHERDMSQYQPQSTKMGNTPKMGLVYYVSVLKRDKVQVVKDQKRRFQAKQGVWCPMVPNTYFVARREGHVYVTGNTRVQGSAGEYNNMSLIEMVKWVREDLVPAKVIMAVHDCIMLEVEEDALDEAVSGGLSIMKQWDSGGVPLEVDVEVGRNWGSMTSDRSQWASL